MPDFLLLLDTDSIVWVFVFVKVQTLNEDCKLLLAFLELFYYLPYSI